ncbi:glycosyltransferase family 2 protein [Halorhodospira sp. 9621]|uniref:glycosyltransferase family 2 protein n=1 Tax=Halorhodospira sp. 9621 TaxID=2899135 RepID=UPI001EE997F3|nr:glycosyltransferase family A protein [Halorhodospira sp. 9621]MCG5532997.1 glycosyltransferase family 2 protein [Halorhodospira sp. 9621]
MNDAQHDPAVLADGSLPITVAIPCFNCTRTIERALASVAAQTQKPAEVVIVDDASTDGSWETLGALQRRCSGLPIRLQKMPVNRGPASTRNVAWDLATQPYIAFLDADDSWHPRKLEIQHSFMRSRPDAMLTGHRLLYPGEPPPAGPPGPITARRVGPHHLLFRNCLQPPSLMIAAHAPYRFPSGRYHDEDSLMVLRMASDRQLLYALDAPLGFTHKPRFGEGGLRGDLGAMHDGQLDTLRALYRERRLSLPTTVLAGLWFRAKHLRRRALHGLRG